MVKIVHFQNICTKEYAYFTNSVLFQLHTTKLAFGCFALIQSIIELIFTPCEALPLFSCFIQVLSIYLPPCNNDACRYHTLLQGL